MKKVVIIHNRLVIGGPAVAIAELINQLHSQFEFHLIVGMPLPDEEDAAYLFTPIPNLTITYLQTMHRMPSLYSDYKAYLQLYNIIKTIAPDVVHTHGTKPGILGRLVAQRLNVHTIIHTYHGHIFHSYFSKVVSTIIVRVEKYLAKRTTYIIAISNILKNEIVDNYKIATNQQTVIIPLGLSLQHFAQSAGEKRKLFRQKYNVTNSQTAIGIVGRITAIKNMGMYVDVIKQCSMLPNFDTLKFFIIGDGDKKNSLQQQLQKAQLNFTTSNNLNDSNIIFTSWIKATDEIMNGIDILCLTSLNEGTPVTIIEAMAAQKPVITTNAGSVTDLVKHNTNGIVTEINNVDTFTNAVQLLVTNMALCAKMGINGYNFVLQHFDPAKRANEIATLYNN